MLGGEKKLDSRRVWLTLLQVAWRGCCTWRALDAHSALICDGFVRSTHAMTMQKEVKTDQLCVLRMWRGPWVHVDVHPSCRCARA
jgi:hypothetical protein